MGPRIRFPREAVTIADVARHVGVATSTVSRALTQPNRVSEDLRLRVIEAANTLGYRPNPQARSLISGRTGSVALMVTDVTNPYFGPLIRGTQAQLRARGYRHLLVDMEDSAEIEEAALEEIPSSVDGLVIMGAHVADDQLREVARRVPLVVINRRVDGLPSVVVDTPPVLVQALEYLVSLGHRSIAFAGGPHHSWSSARRWLAIEAAGRRLGVSCTHVGYYAPGPQSGAAAADAALHAGATACMFFNDLLAIAGLRRLAQRGVRVPEDFSVVGCDDIFGADFCHPPLTTVSVPAERLGRVAADLLLSTLHPGQDNAAAPRELTVPAHLTIRASAGSVPSPVQGRVRAPRAAAPR